MASTGGRQPEADDDAAVYDPSTLHAESLARAGRVCFIAIDDRIGGGHGPGGTRMDRLSTLKLFVSAVDLGSRFKNLSLRDGSALELRDEECEVLAGSATAPG